MKNIILISCLLCAILILSACSNKSEGDTVSTVEDTTENNNTEQAKTINIEQTGYTKTVPSIYLTAVVFRGREVIEKNNF